MELEPTAATCSICNKPLKREGDKTIGYHPICHARMQKKAKQAVDIDTGIAPKKTKANGDERLRFIIQSTNPENEENPVKGGFNGMFYAYRREIELVGKKQIVEYLAGLKETHYTPVRDEYGRIRSWTKQTVRKHPIQILGSA